MELILGLIFVLVIVTVIGHGIWVLIAYVFRRLLGDKSRSTIRRTSRQEIEWRLRDLHGRGEISARQLKDILALLVQNAEPKPSATQESSATPDSISAEPLVAEIVEAVAVEPERQVQDKPQRPAEKPPVVPPKPVDERVREYAQRRATAASQSTTPTVAAVPQKPRRTMAEFFSAFLEEANIRWGELVGGLLIVSCSAALVISFWAEISSRPLLKFGVFNTVISLLFLVGIHASRRWKLPTTSQGVLMTAMLLVPLNFLAIAAFTQNEQPNAITIAGELISIAVFLFLVYFASKILTPSWSVSLMVCGAVLPVSTLLVRRWISTETRPEFVFGLLGGMAAVYGGAQIPVILRLRKSLFVAPTRRQRTDVSEQGIAEQNVEAGLSDLANSVWKLAGIATFALAICVAFFVHRRGVDASTFRELAPYCGIYALPLIAYSLLLWKQTRFQRDSAVSVASISVGCAAVMLMIAGVGFSWPAPLITVICCAVVYATCTWLAFSAKVTEAHFVGIAFLTVGFLFACQIVRSSIPPFNDDVAVAIKAMLSPTLGSYLTASFFVVAAGALLLERMSLRDHAFAYRRSCAVVACFAIGMTGVLGFGRAGDPAHVVWIFSLFSIVAAVESYRSKAAYLNWCIVGLTSLTCIHAFVFAYPFQELVINRWSFALLVASTVLIAGIVAGRFLHKLFHDEFSQAVILFSLFSAMLAVYTGLVSFASLSAPMIGWLAAVWLMLAGLLRKPSCFAAFQVASLIAFGVGIRQSFAGQTWYAADELASWLHPASLHRLLLLGVMFSILFGVSHLLLRMRKIPLHHELRRYVNATFPTVDQIVIAVILVGIAFACLYASAPSVRQELSLLNPSTDGTVIRKVPPIEQFEFLEVVRSDPRQILPWSGIVGVFVSLVIQIGVSGRDRRLSRWLVLGLLVTLACGVLFASLVWEKQVATASATRWAMAGFFAVGSVLIWTSNSWFATVKRFRLHTHRNVSSSFGFAALLVLSLSPIVSMAMWVANDAVNIRPPTLTQSIWILLTLACSVIGAASAYQMQIRAKEIRKTASNLLSLVLSIIFGIICASLMIFVVVQTVATHPVVGPNPGTFFRKIGFLSSYTVPIAIYAFTFIGFAHYFKSEKIALTAAVLVNICATAGFLFVRAKSPMNTIAWMQLAELNSISSSTAVLVWSLWRAKFVTGKASPSKLLQVQFGIACGFFAIPLISFIILLLMRPVSPYALQQIAGLWGWVSFGLLAISALMFRRDSSKAGSLIALSLVAVAIVILAAAESHRFDNGDWLAFHVTMGLFAFVSLAGCLVPKFYREFSHVLDSSAVRRIYWILFSAITLLLSVFALRSMGGDPFSPWIAIVGLIVSVCLLTIIATHFGVYFHSIIAAVAFAMAINIWWFDKGAAIFSNNANSLFDFVRLNTSALAIPVVWWSWIVWRRQRGVATYRGPILYMRFARNFSTFLLFVCGAITSVYGLLVGPTDNAAVVAWLGCAACLLGTLASVLWRVPGKIGIGLYAIGLCAVATLVETLRLPRETMVWSSCLILSAFGLASSYAVSRKPEIAEFGKWLGISTELSTVSESVIRAGGTAIAMIVIILGVWAQYFCEYPSIRLAASQAILAQALAVGLMARGRVATPMRFYALSIGAIAAIVFGWSWLPHNQILLLDRTVIVGTALLVVILIYSVGLIKIWQKENDWTRSAIQLVPTLAGLLVLAFLFVLGVEAYAFVNRQVVVISPFSIAGVAGGFSAVIIACLVFAIWPGRDPFQLPESRRAFYIYAAEACAAMLFAHIRMSMPWLFTGFFQQFWPLIVMGLAFLGVGVAEYTRKIKRLDLAIPFERTGVFLPLLPAIGIWVVPSETNFSLLMLVVAILYAALSVTRKSFGFGILATLAGNVGFWHLLHQQGVSVLDHPQIWLIPPAICVLVATSICRRQLTDSQATSIRYFAASTIYVSSTADIFINGVANAPWLPLVLAAISLAGIFLGILMRIRAFLFLGISFLMVSLLTVIWHAAVDLQQTWLWYVTGIVAGCAILTLFAIFEKKRQQVLQALSKLKEWEA